MAKDRNATQFWMFSIEELEIMLDGLKALKDKLKQKKPEDIAPVAVKWFEFRHKMELERLDELIGDLELCVAGRGIV